MERSIKLDTKFNINEYAYTPYYWYPSKGFYPEKVQVSEITFHMRENNKIWITYCIYGREYEYLEKELFSSKAECLRNCDQLNRALENSEEK